MSRSRSRAGLTGALFTEFAFTLVGAVTISAVVALTLSPMMSSRLLKPRTTQHGPAGRIVAFVDRRFDALRRFYLRGCTAVSTILPVTTVFALLVLPSIYFLYAGAKRNSPRRKTRAS